MPLVAAYHRPTTVDDALALLAEPNRVALAGGTTVNADREPSDVEVVDLQALGLVGIERSDDRLAIGATTTLADVAESDLVPDLVRRMARREVPSTLRTLSTVGGTVAAAGPDSVMVAALLLHDGAVELAGADDRSLAELLTGGVPAGSIITRVTIDPSGAGCDAATGRTPADVPIVAALARSTPDGPRVVLTGVGPAPVAVDPADPTFGLEPEGDFRGSTEYRRHLVSVLTKRAMEGLR